MKFGEFPPSGLGDVVLKEIVDGHPLPSAYGSGELRIFLKHSFKGTFSQKLGGYHYM